MPGLFAPPLSLICHLASNLVEYPVQGKDAMPKPCWCDHRTAHLDDKPILDACELSNRGLEEDEIKLVLRGSTCVSEEELHDRWCMRETGRP